jgi:3-keto-disaccharide hydrolase
VAETGIVKVGLRFLLAVVAVLNTVAAGEVIRFDPCAPGKLPEKWTVAMTHAGAAPQWQLVQDESAPGGACVLAQTSQDRTAGRFPLAIWDGAVIRDGQVSVAFKAVTGSVDRAAGIVWRYRDPNNYYIVRANALENNVVFYKVENGTRASIAPKGLPSRAYGVKRNIPKGRWNTLEVTFSGSLFTILLNGERLFEAEDRTFAQAGRTGLWTKADSVTYFDAFNVTAK